MSVCKKASRNQLDHKCAFQARVVHFPEPNSESVLQLTSTAACLWCPEQRLTQLVKNDVLSLFSLAVVFVCLFTFIIFTAAFIHLVSVLQERVTEKMERERGAHARRLMKQTQSCDSSTL